MALRIGMIVLTVPLLGRTFGVSMGLAAQKFWKNSDMKSGRHFAKVSITSQSVNDKQE
jgi:hypothetical protein